MNNTDYWAERFRLLEESTYKHSEAWIKNADKQFDKSLISIKDKVAWFYQQFEDLTGFNFAEAKRALDNKTLKEFKITVDEYIKMGESLNENFDPGTLKKLQKASLRVRISRYEAIQYFIQAEIAKLHGNFLEETYKMLGEAYENRYYQTAYEMASLGFSFSKLNKGQIKAALDKPWSETHFSSSIWNNQNKLQKNLTDVITQAVITGQSYSEATKLLDKKMAAGSNNCARIITTEMAAVSSQAQQEMFKELNVKKYIVVATLDERTSQVCQSLDGKIFNETDYSVGVTAPPFHPNCRTTTAPYNEDLIPGKRIARDPETGKSVYVDNVSYYDWAKENGIEPVYGLWEPPVNPVVTKKELEPVNEINLGGMKNRNLNKKQAQFIKNKLENSQVEVKKIWNFYSDDMNYSGKLIENGKNTSIFKELEQATYFDPKTILNGSNVKMPGQTAFHEQGHHIDNLLALFDPNVDMYEGFYYSSEYQNGKFYKTLNKEFEENIKEFFKKDPESAIDELELFDLQNIDINDKAVNKIIQQAEDGIIDEDDLIANPKVQEYIWKNNKEYIVKQWIDQKLYEISEEFDYSTSDDRIFADLSDIIESCSVNIKGCKKTKVNRVGHGESYWLDNKGMFDYTTQAAEAFAEIFSSLLANEKSYNVIKKIFPKTENVFQEMLRKAAELIDEY